MCQVCQTLYEKVEKAKAEQNPEKARVMAVIFRNHLEIDHKQRKKAMAIVDVDYVVWPNGTRWEVVR